MQPNGVGDFPVPVATSGAPTDDGQSTRQVPANTISSEEVPTASFRAHMPYERSTISSKQRRGGNLVLFVKPNENESEAASRGTSFSPHQQQANGSGADGDVEGFSEEGDENVAKDQEDAPSLVISTFVNAAGSVGSMATGATRRPLVTAALVLLYFILLDLVLLSGNERLNRVLRRMRAAEDDALILLSTSLVRQMAEAKQELRDAVTQRGGNVKTDGFEMARHKLEALERVCNRSISRLHAKLMFPGSVEDLLFLIESHATYDERLRELAAHELHWATTVMTGHVVHAGGDDVEESQPHGPGTARPAAHSPAAGGDAHPSAQEGNTDAALNPLRNVRLQHVRQYRAPTKLAASSYAWRLSTRAKSTATSRRQSGGTSAFASAVSAVAKATRGLLELVSNKLVAFLLICALLSAVLRMG
ncbi:conserved hypothetical protein [Leishmania major strain Friedlin]|uniref:Uncharacterized protein n=1 Tax=Leishmania major TaxID=5664 RepID=E9AD81_LEIMA|nr:conserved hypothetical protein [Leishmania major strain Friedlin]CAG9576706.1 hypothetical_protein_-_conserved [Leishmania major strain Friedlin]CBZ12166.1 conserved hypothetical protein [Leishmania major strain Friedlin]|eukprot:XP_003721910.1 conserved hypothetical protein [Leishmania major strain Friedlin]